MTKFLQKYTILYIEDEYATREMVVEYLKNYCLDIYEATDAESAYQLYIDKKPDIIITDIELSQVSGLTLVEKIRQIDFTIPVIVTTAYTDTNYLLKAVELNLIKYLIKPINETKLKSALKLCVDKLEILSQTITNLGHGFLYDSYNFELIYDKKPVALTSSQNHLLKLLISNKDRVVTYSEIENHIWEYKGMSEAALRSLIHDIRKIIHKDIIKNISKIGYKINIHE